MEMTLCEGARKMSEMPAGEKRPITWPKKTREKGEKCVEKQGDRIKKLSKLPDDGESNGSVFSDEIGAVERERFLSPFEAKI